MTIYFDRTRRFSARVLRILNPLFAAFLPISRPHNFDENPPARESTIKLFFTRANLANRLSSLILNIIVCTQSYNDWILRLHGLISIKGVLIYINGTKTDGF